MARNDDEYEQSERSRDERSQKDQTRRRRKNRSRRRRYMLVALGALLVLLVLAIPTLLCSSGIASSMVAESMASYGLSAEINSIRVGWMAPLKIEGLTIRPLESDSNTSEVSVGQLDTSLTAMQLLRFDPAQLGEILIRDLQIRGTVRDGSSSFEDDFQGLLTSDDPSSGSAIASVRVQNASVDVTDAETGKTWSLNKSNAEVMIDGDVIKGNLTGVVTQADGRGGSLQAEFKHGSAESPNASDTGWRVVITSDALPLSVGEMAARRFQLSASEQTPQLSGTATGSISLIGNTTGNLQASVDDFQIKDVHVAGIRAVDRPWSNRLATIDGQFSWVDGWVIGHGLTATTDFASATLDGAFSTNMSLVGADNNPLRWLEALDGQASAEVDLATLHQALPGIIPVREGTELISGKSTATIESVRSANADSQTNANQQSKLTIKTDSIRARAADQTITFQPIELTATVSKRDGIVHADDFHWKSVFGSASGSGSFRNGSADIDVDFGRLHAMLRPIIDLSEISLGGTADGQISWNASANDVWELHGRLSAENLLFTTPDGQRIERSAAQCNVSAVGKWGDEGLKELSQGEMRLASAGVDLTATLSQPVVEPTIQSSFPIQVKGNGRVESLTQTFQSWLPDFAHDAEGGFVLSADGAISSNNIQLTTTEIDLTQPRMAWGNQWIGQPRAHVEFNGSLEIPAGNLTSQSLTVVGDAISLAVEGEHSSEKTDLRIAWRANLQRVQKSLRPRMARATGDIQQVNFVPDADSNSNRLPYQFTGSLDGKLSIRSVVDASDQPAWDLVSETTGKELAVYQASQISAVNPSRSLFAAPQPNAENPNQPSPNDLIWSEPNLEVVGTTRYHTDTGHLSTEGLQVAGDWFATTLSGQLAWDESTREVSLKGPARFKMDDVAKHLTRLSGTTVGAFGIHDTPLTISIKQDDSLKTNIAIECSIGWETADAVGISLGRSSLPIKLTGSSLHISQSVVPVETGGQVNFAGDVFFGDGPLRIELQPSSSARDIHVTKQMSNGWLKYITPLAAEATQVQGLVGCELDEAIIRLDDPTRSRVKGRLNVQQLQLSPGPLAASIVQGVDQLKALSRGQIAQQRDITQKTLVTMMPQSVDFRVENAVVSHQRLYLQIDRAQLITSGQVGLDSSVNMVAQVPLDESWIGSDLKNMSGQSISMPITGTLTQPKLDPRGVQNLLMQLGTQAVQQEIQNKLQDKIQKEVSSGLEKIFGL